MRRALQVTLWLGLTLSLSQCGNPSPKGPMSFDEFVRHEMATSPEQTQVATDCDQVCLDFRQEFRYVVYVGKAIY